MNGFQRHNIVHSSPSSLNMWASAPCAWVARYLLDQKFKFSNAAKAGSLVEEAIVNIIANGWTEEKAISEALKEYNKSCAFSASDADRKRGDAIPGMITNAVQELSQYGEPEFGTDLVYGKKQKKIEIICNGDDWRLPIVGYLDLYFPKENLVVDIKTSMKLPSCMSSEHMRQGAVYRGAMGNATVKFLYVTGKGYKWHEVENHVPILAEFKEILNRQEKFLKLGNADFLKSIVPVMAGSFYWSGDEALRKEIYNV